MAGLSVAGVGIAAAVTAGSGAQATAAFRRSAQVHQAQVQAPAPAAAVPSPPTTTADGVTNTPSQTLVWSGTVPDGPTLQLYAAAETTQGTCAVLVASPAGAATALGKPSYTPRATCEPADVVNSTAQPASDFSGSMWQSATGRAFMLVYGHAAATTTRLIVSDDGTDQTVAVTNGWYAFAVPYSGAPVYTETAYSTSGQMLGSVRH